MIDPTEIRSFILKLLSANKKQPSLGPMDLVYIKSVALPEVFLSILWKVCSPFMSEPTPLLALSSILSVLLAIVLFSCVVSKVKVEPFVGSPCFDDDVSFVMSDIKEAASNKMKTEESNPFTAFSGKDEILSADHSPFPKEVNPITKDRGHEQLGFCISLENLFNDSEIAESKINANVEQQDCSPKMSYTDAVGYEFMETPKPRYPVTFVSIASLESLFLDSDLDKNSAINQIVDLYPRGIQKYKVILDFLDVLNIPETFKSSYKVPMSMLMPSQGKALKWTRLPLKYKVLNKKRNFIIRILYLLNLFINL